MLPAVGLDGDDESERENENGVSTPYV